MNRRTRTFTRIRAILLGLAVAAIAIYLTRNLLVQEERKKDALRRVRERGYLVALTDQNTLNYFIYKGEPMGYQLKLLESFAEYLGVPLRIIATNDMRRMEYYLRYNAADLIALNLPISREGKKIVNFSDPFGETRLVLVQRRNNHPKNGESMIQKSLTEFPDDTVYACINPFLSNQYHSFYKKTGKHAIIKEVAGISPDELIGQVAGGKIRFALCQENVAMVYHRYYSNLDVSLLAFPHFSYGWGMGEACDSLRDKVNGWLKEMRSSRDLRDTYLAYFNNQRIARFMQSDYFSVNSNKLSPYDKAIRESSKMVRWDWRLVASVVYEESNFQPGQVSSRSASGLMQLLPETAAKFGIDSNASPAGQIAAGVKYLRYLDKQLPDEITSPIERIYFTLASYNVGIGKVLTAREKAEKYGRDRNRWNGHVDYYLLRRSHKDPIAKTDTVDSFPVDYKMEGFVDDIVTRYYHYRNLIR